MGAPICARSVCETLLRQGERTTLRIALKKEATKERHICAPMCLLYSKNGTLIPLAIQLTQVPTVHTPIYTK